MGQITVEKNVGGIEGLCVITPAVHGDARGYFMETYNEREMKEAGFDIQFVQDNQSMSVKAYCADCISRSTIRSANSCAPCAEAYLMWQWIFAKVPQPMENGMVWNFPRKTKSSF